MWNCHSGPLDVSSVSRNVRLSYVVLCWGGLSASYIYALYKIWQLNWFGVLVWKASMLDRWGVHLTLTCMHGSRCISMCNAHCRWQYQGGSICLWYLYVFYMHWYFLIYSYKLTVSNGFSLTVWKRIAVTFSSSSFEWGVHLTLVSLCFLYALVFPYIFL